MLSKATGKSEKEKAKKPLFSILHFSFLGLCVTGKQKSIVVNWRVGDAHSTVHMQDGT